MALHPRLSASVDRRAGLRACLCCRAGRAQAAAAAAIGGGGVAGGHAAHLLIQRGGARHGHPPRPALFFFFPAPGFLRTRNFFAFLATFLWQKFLRQNILWLTNLQQNNFREEISINRIPTYLFNLNFILKRCSRHRFSPPMLLSRSRNLLPCSCKQLPHSRKQLPRSNAPLTLSPSPLSHEARQRMISRPPKHSSSLLPLKP